MSYSSGMALVYIHCLLVLGLGLGSVTIHLIYALLVRFVNGVLALYTACFELVC